MNTLIRFVPVPVRDPGRPGRICRRFLVWCLVVVLAVTTPALFACGVSNPPPHEATSSATKAQPDARSLEASLEQSIAGGSVALGTIEAVLVSVDGRPLFSHYRNGRRPDTALHTYSVTKSVTSALIGIAVGEGLIADLDQTLSELLPRHRSQLSGELARVTLRQLLDMSAGFADERQAPNLFDAVLKHDGDAVRLILERGLVSPPGESFAYSNVGAHLITAILATALERADGDRPRTVLAYAQQKLFAPLDIDTTNAYSERFRWSEPVRFERAGVGWATDARGVHSGCCLLRLRAADLLKIGELYLNDGLWRGRRVLPAGWVATSTTPSPINPSYGLLWWLENSVAGGPAYLARGSGGQLILVSPEDRLVVVVASQPTKDYATSDDDVYALVSSVILPAFA